MLPVVLTTALSCKPDQLHPIDGNLSVTTLALHFPDTWLGYPTQQMLKLRNSSPGKLDASLSIDGAYFSVSTQATVEGGETLEVPVTFDPRVVGTFNGVVHVGIGGVTTDVSLSGSSLQPPTCNSSNFCDDLHFDPTSGQCVDQRKPDGTDCSLADLCLDHPVCQGGLCVGSPKTCDDHNVCTQDVCDPTQGCIHVDQTSQCPTPSDPCQVATCDPSGGCGTGSAPDGTLCGSADCVTAHICLLGGCREVNVPDGTQCTLPTPCQNAGACHNQECQVPDAGEMVPVWSYTAPADAQMVFPGVIDDNDNLYWVECAPAPTSGSICELVSATRDGYERYRVVLDSQSLPQYGNIYSCAYAGGNGYESTFMLAGDVLIFPTSSRSLEARTCADGGLAWSVDLPTTLHMDGADAGPTDPDAMSWMLTQPSVVNSNTVVIGVWSSDNGTGVINLDGQVAALHLQDGTVSWQQTYPGYFLSMSADENNHIYFGVQQEVPTLPPPTPPTSPPILTWADTVVSLNADGSSRWTTPPDTEMEARGPIATYDNWVVMTDPYEVQSTPLVVEDGGFLVMGGPSYWVSYYDLFSPPVFDTQVGYTGTILPAISYDDGGYVAPQGAVVGFDPKSGQALWTKPLDGNVYQEGLLEPFLTSRETMLVLSGQALALDTNEDNPEKTPAGIDACGPGYLYNASLQEYDPAGHRLYSCNLPTGPDGGPDSSLVNAVLGHERYYVSELSWTGGGYSIQAFAVPGVDPATTGWISRAGNPQRTNRPR
jgi:hypothetical protein